MNTKSLLVTGCAGFIGAKVCEFLLTRSELIPSEINDNNEPSAINVIGIDNLNDYYDVRLKHWRLDQLKKFPNFEFHKLDIENYAILKKLFESYSQNSSASALPSSSKNSLPSQRDTFQHDSSPFSSVINLAARAGVRYSMENPFVYYTTNVMGNLNLLELCRQFGVKKFILASTSSLYAGQKMPFKESLPVNEPISPYAASKKGGEVTCYTYHRQFDIDVSIVRYFTVYGPAGRPDMSIFRFISWIDRGEPAVVYGDGSQSRDFTYVDDIARGTIAAIKPLGFEIINLGGDCPHKLMDVLRNIERQLDKKACITHEPFHSADMLATSADITKAKHHLKWHPEISIEQGIDNTIKWYKDNHAFTSTIELT